MVYGKGLKKPISKTQEKLIPAVTAGKPKVIGVACSAAYAGEGSGPSDYLYAIPEFLFIILSYFSLRRIFR